MRQTEHYIVGNQQEDIYIMRIFDKRFRPGYYMTFGRDSATPLPGE